MKEQYARRIRHQQQGWNACLNACLAIVRLDGGASQRDLLMRLASLRQTIRVGAHVLEIEGRVYAEKHGGGHA